MKDNQKCPKCNGKEIIRIPGMHQIGGGVNISCGITIFGVAKVARFLCTNCGYVEQWIEKPSDLEKIKRKYKQKIQGS